MTAEQEASEDAPQWGGDIRALVSGANLVVLIAVIALAASGLFDSMTDAGGDRFWGNSVMAAPAIYAGWCMLELAWKRLPHLGFVLLRLGTACVVAPAFAAVPIGVIQAIAIAFPGVRDTIAEAKSMNGGFHYWWDEGLPTQLLLMPFASYAIGMSVALMVVIIIVLPVVSIRAPQIAAQGSHIEKVDGAQRVSTTAFVFIGLGVTTLGILLWSFGNGRSLADFPEDFGRFVRSASSGYVYWADGVWLLGVVCVAVGVALLAWGCVRVMIARGRTAGTQP